MSGSIVYSKQSIFVLPSFFINAWLYFRIGHPFCSRLTIM
jgi:hypothetical protein